MEVEGLIFPIDFYIVNMKYDKSPNPTPMLLGRQFLEMAMTNINVSNGTLTMKFDGEIIKFNIFYSMKYPADCHYVFFIDIIYDLSNKF